MISIAAATWFVRALLAYLVIGLLWAAPFVFRWSHDEAAAANGSIGFRVLILPGAVLLWPLLLGRRRTRPALRNEPHDS